MFLFFFFLALVLFLPTEITILYSLCYSEFLSSPYNFTFFFSQYFLLV
uniref:Uncharacterized protein n=1 Tax=Rhizophora mucronata TaxID=61149 RepID=A0A2P2JGE2_RHIMU